MEKFVINLSADNMLAYECAEGIASGRLGSAFEVHGNEAVFSLAELDDLPFDPKSICPASRPADDKDKQWELDESGLPKPHDYIGPKFSALDYFNSEEYAQAKTLGEAIEIRGFKALVDNAEPDDFSDTVPGVRKIGFAELWSQSTWERGSEERDVEQELEALSIDKGDLLTIKPVDLGPDEVKGQNFLEVRDIGFAFYKGDTMLPYTPYHDYEQDLFINALLALDEGQLIVCLVRSNDCTGQDGIPVDENFCWRVYTPKVEVFKIGPGKNAAK